MKHEQTPYRCRSCGAASYRRLTHRGPEGAMTYSDLYCCSGCSVTFADPMAWRQAAVQQAPGSTVRHKGAGIGPSDHTGPKPELMSSWGSKPTMTPDASTCGYNASQSANTTSTFSLRLMRVIGAAPSH